MPRGTRQVAAASAGSADPRRGIGLLLRGGRRHLRLRGGNGQEPGPSCAHPAVKTPLHHRRARLRPGSYNARDSVGRWAQLSTDLVVLEDEVNPVIGKLEERGLELSLNWNLSSTSRPPGCSASTCRPCCSPAPTK